MSPSNRALKELIWKPAGNSPWRFPKIAKFFLSVLIATAAACTAPEVSVPLTEAVVPASLATRAQIQSVTILPVDFSNTNLAHLGKELVTIPKSLLSYSYIQRPRAEFRSGPGSEFDLLDSTLEGHDKVIIFDTIGVWSKVISPRLGISGWVHRKALASDLEADSAEIEVAVKLLPTVIAIEAIDHVYSYGDLGNAAVSITRGTQFIALRKVKGRTLVWLTETNSVAWISDQSVK
jgi:hypothetical protein